MRDAAGGFLLRDSLRLRRYHGSRDGLERSRWDGILGGVEESERQRCAKRSRELLDRHTPHRPFGLGDFGMGALGVAQNRVDALQGTGVQDVVEKDVGCFGVKALPDMMVGERESLDASFRLQRLLFEERDLALEIVAETGPNSCSVTDRKKRHRACCIRRVGADVG